MRPFGTTCAMSPSLTVSFPSLAVPNCTFKFSTTSGLSLPPGLRRESSCVRCSIAFRIDASRTETSYASSVGVGDGFLTGGEESERAWFLLAFPAFLRREGLEVKLRIGCKVHWALDAAGRALDGDQLRSLLRLQCVVRVHSPAG
jgi:hypothetical protein